jgi:sortase A
MNRCCHWLLVFVGLGLLINGGWIHAKAALAQVLLDRAWQQTLDGETEVRPWRWADTWPVARLTIPRLDTSLVVLEGSSGRTLAFAPGHTQGSSQPGEPGTSIVSGHRDTHFSVLAELREGDEIAVERSDGRIIYYEVGRFEIADARTSRIAISAEEDLLILVTCWPFNAVTSGGKFRYVATAHQLSAVGSPW